ncbi:uncharacterized protein K444DRAFT_666840 [Hyaloscypha bicolor E]|uniref:Azaphilone pigments biosynthesis cluster protein L N-terminal domain-containing protein n=1 Tax=Hyaloscypha bicolor E TaxID=1095630 RepID=A0A2J6SW30_9HELO|nr:uncharacterized protein K444DRAFT_666840 [Hyaloscypha bicolor E]PMD54883.1 hypothetical protein K444DRAFT_666840 [Hyaloscypha bicolor E]
MMVDPLSIAASSAALAQLCFKLSVAINGFVGDVRSIDDKIQTLHQGLNSLSQILTGVSLAWTSNPEVAAAQTGPDGQLWVSVKDSISRCAAVLDKFEQLLNRVSTDSGTNRGILRRSVSKIKFNFNTNDMDGFRTEIDIYHRVLVIALNSINTCAILRRDRTDAEVSQRLGTIEAGIDGLNRQLVKGRTQSLMPGSEAADTLKGFLNAANAFRASASTFSSSGSTTTAKSATVRGGSVFGDPLSKEKLDKIKRWIPAPTERGSEGSVTDVASSSGWNGSVQDVESLPQLMSVLENVTQMADRFQALEKQKHFTKDEEIRLLRERCEQQEKKSKDLEQTYTATNENLKKELEHNVDFYEHEFRQSEHIIAELREREKKISEAHDILAKKNDNLLMKLDEETIRTGMLARGMNDLRENFTRERVAFEGKLESVASSMADLQACVEVLTEEKGILEAKNETLESEKRGLIRVLSETTAQNSRLEIQYTKLNMISDERMTEMVQFFEKNRITEAETYRKELADVEARYCAIMLKLKEENDELITKNSVAQAALIEKVERFSLVVPQMMQDLMRNLSKQATDFKDGCASLTANIKESPREEIGESKA